ncbi:peptidylprolyl isomerase [archaeon]|nr:peptidylprolyl isomerase [archaeon]
MAFKKGDFIEIQFTGKVKDGDIFDSNIKEDLAKANIQGQDSKFVFSVGEGMFVKGVDEFLIGKEVGEYEIEVKPEDAFGKRNPKLIQMIPLKVFAQHQLNPIPGAMFNFDNKLARVLTVSGGRVMVDFNNPVAGKILEYKIKVLRKVEDVNEKINAMNDFFFRQEFKFEIKDKDLILDVPQGSKKFIEMFAEKYKELLDFNLKANEVAVKK